MYMLLFVVCLWTEQVQIISFLADFFKWVCKYTISLVPGGSVIGEPLLVKGHC